MLITYPDAHNLSVSAPGEERRGAQPEPQARPVVGSMSEQGPGSARNSSYRLVSMATRQPVVPQILKE